MENKGDAHDARSGEKKLVELIRPFFGVFQTKNALVDSSESVFIEDLLDYY